ncbi:cell wall-binding repeat-containing protein [Bifidobacterium sp. LC6]|uniref:Cell wall-binding repeat-containing protein n=1 Tax=Bifidobacterium colobi TaxID=2809026 RepID=A0ABS5V0M2_9BIFI|nr:RICIN domain-containing protein [Bifidobacterium colobi]MBT1175783.1 cell wall-binding repeat-containing protein [Bifidobacterium colobi]
MMKYRKLIAGIVSVALASTLGLAQTAGAIEYPNVESVNDTSSDGISQVTKNHTPKTEKTSFSSSEDDQSIAPYSLDENESSSEPKNDATPSSTGVITASADLSGLATVGVTWKQQDMSDHSKAPSYRLRTFQNNKWGDWVELPSVDEDADVMGVSASYYVGNASKVEAELTPVDGQTLSEAKLVTVDSGYSAGNAQSSAFKDANGSTKHVAKSAVLTDKTTAKTQQTAAVTATGTIHTREEWWVNGNPAMTWSPERTGHWKGAIVHHTVDRNNYSQAEVPAMINGIYVFHNVTRGWGDIGYQIIVDRFGGIWEGRDEGVPNQIVPASQVAGAQAYSFNYDTFGVALLGSYHLSEAPTDAQIRSTAAAIAWEFDALGISDPYGTFQYLGTQARITGHGDHSHGSANNTACPGQQVWNRMGTIRDLVKSYLNDVTHLPALSVGSGTFYIDSAKQLESSLQAENGSTAEGASIRLQSGTKDAMGFEFNQQSDGSYEIVNKKSGLVLGVKDEKASNGAAVQQQSRNNKTSQRWWLRTANTGGVYIQSALGNWVLDLVSGNTQDGTLAQLYEPNGTQAQQFIVASATAAIPKNPVQLTSVADVKLSVGIADASFDAGKAVQLQNTDSSDAQLFAFNQAGNGVYSIINLNSGNAVEVASGGMTSGTAVRQWTPNGTLAQLWALRDAGNGQLGLANAKSGLVLDVPHGKPGNGVALQIYSSNGTVAQSWIAKSVESSRGVVKRLYGQLRYDTADAVIDAGFKQSRWVVIASGESYPDALVASAVAGALKAPVMLSEPDSLDNSAVDRIRQLGVTKAVFIGGQGVLSTRLETQVKNLVSEHQVIRFGGATRYDTSLDVLTRAPELLNFEWSNTVVMATGESYPDALSASSMSWAMRSPVVLVQDGNLDEELAQTILSARFNHALLIGGEGVIAKNVEKRLVSLDPTRLGGADRYETSAAVAEYAVEKGILKTDGAVFATGENYPDALAGSALAGSTGNVLLLVGDSSTQAVDAVAKYQTKGNKSTAFILGGEGVVSWKVAQHISTAFNKRLE